MLSQSELLGFVLRPTTSCQLVISGNNSHPRLKRATWIPNMETAFHGSNHVRFSVRPPAHYAEISQYGIPSLVQCFAAKNRKDKTDNEDCHENHTVGPCREQKGVLFASVLPIIGLAGIPNSRGGSLSGHSRLCLGHLRVTRIDCILVCNCRLGQIVVLYRGCGFR